MHRIDLMFGCASLPGTDPDALALRTDLSLPPSSGARRDPAARAAAPLHRDAPARARRRSTPERALIQLPPLIKGYLRLGGFVGEGAVIDAQFNTTDVAVVVQTDLVTEKYYRHYERQSREAPD